MRNDCAVPRIGRWIAAFGILIGAAAAASAADAPALRIDPKEIIPLRQVRPGMKGYGLTVFKGTRVEQFQFEVLGVLPNQYMGKPLVLIRMSGGPITTRQANLIAGMSGSPCYLHGRLMGAFAFGNAWPKEPIGMVTPIEEMAEAFDPRLPDQPAGLSLPHPEPPELLASPALPDLPGSRAPTAASLTGDWMRPYPMAIPVTISGASGRNLDRLMRSLRSLNMLAQLGPGGNPALKAPPLGPGSAIGVSLATGDIEMTAFGTVTYRKGDRLLIFGHPMLGIGAVQLPITTAVVYDVFPGFPMSNKIASAGKIVGTTLQDRPFSVSARIGPRPPMIPVTCEVEDRGTGRRQRFRSEIASHPLLVNLLADFVCTQAIANVHSVPRETTATVTVDVRTEEYGALRRENVVFDLAGIETAAVRDLNEMLRILSSNTFRRVPVREISMKVLLEAKRSTAAVERIFVLQDRYAPGDTVEVGVVLRPYRGEPFLTKAEVRIPHNAANGRATLTVSGGPPRPEPVGLTIGPGGQAPPQGPPQTGPTATSVAQLLRRFLERERNNELVTRIVLPTTTVSVAGEKLSLLPANLAEIMRSSKSTGLRLEREEVRAAKAMECVLSGTQTLQITIEREDHSESPEAAADGRGPGSPPTGSSGASGVGSSTRSLGLEEEPELFAPALPLEPMSRVPLAAQARVSRGSASRASAASPAPAPGGAPTAPRPDDNRPVGRTAAVWKQSTQAEFARGTLKGTAVSASGEVRLAPVLRLLFESPEQYLWSVAAGPDAVYAGSGNSGFVYRVTPSGEAQILFKTGELEVHALARDDAGNLYAGTSPNGKVIRIGPDGKGSDLLTLGGGTSASSLTTPPDGPQFVLAIALGAGGTVYAGTGPAGRVLQIEGAGKARELLAVPDKPIQSLLAAPDGTVWAGTAVDGLLYAIAPDGTARVVYDSDQSAITSLARAEDGTIYAGTAPRGTVFQVSPTGETKVLLERARSAVQALTLDAAGTLYAASGNVIYRIRDPQDVTLLTDSARAQFVALAREPSGGIIAASANVGSLYRLETSREGTYESPVHDAKQPSRWGAIRWNASVPAGALIRFETRSGDTREPDSTWSAWSPVAAGGRDRTVLSPPARYLQYRATLTAGAGEGPVLRDVAIHYLTRNQNPTVTLAAPAGGALLRGTQTVRWTGTDPDRDTLTYEVFLSPDEGRTWLPLGSRIRSPAPPRDVASRPVAPGGELRDRIAENLAANPLLARFRQAVEDDPELTGELREEALQRADRLIAGVGTPAEERGVPLAAAPAAAGSRPPTAGGRASTRETSIPWDTTQVPDGLYLLKVVASDRISNPGSPETAEVVSEPVRVVNRAPWLYLFRKSLRPTPDGGVTLDGLAESGAPLQAAQYRVDGGEWTAIEPADGIWDGEFEAWSLTTGPLAPGRRALEVKVIDAAGNTTVKALSLTGFASRDGR